MNKTNGSIVYSLLLLLVLTILGMSLLVRSANESKVALRGAGSAQAFWLAEAGVQRTIWESVHNSCQGFVQQGTATACTSCSVCGGGNKTLAVSVSGAGDYDVVLNNAMTSATVTGSYPSRTSAKKIQRNVQVTLGVSSPFAFAAFARGQVTLANNTYVDSYDSSAGAYNVTTNSGTNGDVGSNGTTAGIIAINNNVSLGGDVSTGPSGTVTVGSGTAITGTTTHTNNVNLPNVVVPSSLTSLPIGGTLTLGNNAATTLTAGNYRYTNFDFGNGSTLNLTGGQVNIYLTGAAALTLGNNVNIAVGNGASVRFFVDGIFVTMNNTIISSVSARPKDIQIYSTYTGASGIDIKNNSDFQAAVYAPNTGVSIGNNGDIYGSIIGKTVSLSNNAGLHNDETLQTLANSTVGTTGITLWQEI